MKSRTLWGFAIVCAWQLAAALPGWACGSVLPLRAKQVVSDDPALRARAIKILRESGPEGLDELMHEYGPLIQAHLEQGNPPAGVLTAHGHPAMQPVIPAKPAGLQAEGQKPAVEIGASGETGAEKPESAQAATVRWERVKMALDEVGAQKDNYVSGLYWYTDLAQAEAEAAQRGRPILSLHLLGKLTDDLSCANSRFFRTILYPNAEIQKTLREKYVLHWETVRQVPVVTIDFGDGRKIVRTITGNSIHYVLDAQGRPIEAIPGLYGQAAFARQLEAAHGLFDSLQKAGDEKRNEVLRAYHQNAFANIVQAWQRDLHGMTREALHYGPLNTLPVSAEGNPNVSMPQLLNVAKQLDLQTTDGVWQQIASLHAVDAQLDSATESLVLATAKPSAMAAGRLAIGKSMVETPWMKLLRNLRTALSLDTVKNEYTLHRQLHLWFATGQANEIKSLNERVYAQLFLMPTNDPWLGLDLPDQFSALPNGGKIEPYSAKGAE
ncbi:MAG TPA: hypothetical protein VFE24_17380 [Pirellulales bacterium]|jgi:hypothetical protein|nr:hypothetical protein [Pirellulales bacterium]